MDRKKGKIKRFRELQRHSHKNLDEIKEKDGVVDASELFKAKRKLDKWWKEALERVNNINGTRKDKKDDK
jgi:hypothetical protein